MTFWEHLDELRAVIIRCMLVTALFACVAFCLREQLFHIILLPKGNGLTLINTSVTGQFVTHMTMSLYAGLLCALPYLLYQIFGFISPALYTQERRLAVRLVVSGYVMFMVGAMFSFFVIFPITLQFLGTYQVSKEVSNLISLDSYVDTLLTLTLLLGCVFELPIVCWLLGRMGVLNRKLMRQYRRHAVVAILVVAAIITPTSDAFTLMLVSVPIYLLYECSIWLVRSGK